MKVLAAGGSVTRPVRRYTGARAAPADDVIAIEEPLQITLEWPGGRKPLAVTMRTPGADAELALGFLWGEGILNPASVVREVAVAAAAADGNEVRVVLAAQPPDALLRQERNTYLTSSCGICSRAALDAVRVRAAFRRPTERFSITSAVLHALPQQLSAGQALFAGAGSVHAAALFDASGALEAVAEDVGRHNALDKVIGAAYVAGRLPLFERGVAVSGRASFELVQKAHMAGIRLLAAVGAPSSLAIDLAWEADMTLVGFLRDGRFNVYSAPAGIIGQDEEA
ncbi:MAG: formate dehydrogenase accessory sulfurtransferase FdhD [Gammaproteobacteria bacterium]|nr:formate dehydrogenase accessory sulfurtransferase FdhD [Gammaproteobacteria bacterium]